MRQPDRTDGVTLVTDTPDRHLIDEDELQRRLSEARMEGYVEGYRNGRDDVRAGIIPGAVEATAVLDS